MPFQLQKLGPNWELAELHGMATMPGIVQSSSQYEEELCPCCYNTIYKDKAPLCDNSKQLEFLGFGFPLYFVFIKYCIVLLLILIASYNFITLYWAIIFSNALCATQSIDTQAICTNTMVKWSRIEPIVTQQEIMLRISSFCIQMALLIYIRDLLTKTRAYYD